MSAAMAAGVMAGGEGGENETRRQWRRNIASENIASSQRLALSGKRRQRRQRRIEKSAK
jgi:hypothetical protein